VARAQGVTRAVFDRATAGFALDPEVIELASRQPEHSQSVGDYVGRLVTAERVDTGRRLSIEHQGILDALDATYNVDRHILIAIWGVESAFGTSLGSRSVIRSLATLAMLDERRATFWRKELVAALRILQEGLTTPATLVGSWAGAMGHTQFIPSTYRAHAVDFDKDGKRDIWATTADALGSTANYLRHAGWAEGVPWGIEVKLPANFDYALSMPSRPRPIAEWQALGVKAALGKFPPLQNQGLQLLLPAGARGPAFLVTGNYRAILKYNQSMSYAVAVGYFADRLAGKAPLVGRWPIDDKPLMRAEREELQQLLAARGHLNGAFDGIMGNQTRTAIRAAQRTLKIAEDGHPSLDLLQQLRAEGSRQRLGSALD
jgi:membrane-bound lytic murein transglycosylase B